MSEKTVTVKGTVYDKRTGMPLHLERGELHTKSAQQIHHSLQKSKTLNRRYIKRDDAKPIHISPLKQEEVAAHTIVHHHVPTPQTTSRPQAVTHFAKHASRPVSSKVISDIGPTPHSLAVNASKKIARPQVHTTVKPSQILKQEAIAKAMAQVPAKADRKDITKGTRSKMKRMMSIASASLAVLLLGGYFTYLSMPSISTRVAAAQAGISANYPGYQPSGYSLSGPVAYQQGKVTMTFAANAGPSTYTLDQTKSGWDSSAVLDSYVKPHAGDDYQTTTSNGLTIYTYGSNAAWVNGGIFYTISGDAPLSDDQIQHIATSL